MLRDKAEHVMTEIQELRQAVEKFQARRPPARPSASSWAATIWAS